MTNNIDRLRKAYARWDESRGADAEEFYALISDDFVMHSVPDQPAARPEFVSTLESPKRGKELIAGYFARLLGDWQMEYYRVDALFGDDKQVAMFGQCKWTSRKTWKSATTRIADLWKFENGEASEMIEIFDTAAAMAAATE